ncbi:MAG: response regulator [Methanomicrobiales archaeon]|nr:response regulator [Methanomicrobiales archaeon]
MERKEILLIEDDTASARLTGEALRESAVPCTLTVVRDGMEAMAYLKKEGDFSGTPLPDLILMDINLPRKSGWEVLREIRADARLQHIPVVVMTGMDPGDRTPLEELGISRFIVKPGDLDGYFRCIQSILDVI